MALKTTTKPQMLHVGDMFGINILLYTRRKIKKADFYRACMTIIRETKILESIYLISRLVHCKNKTEINKMLKKI